jgi:hypothetical protein
MEIMGDSYGIFERMKYSVGVDLLVERIRGTARTLT